MQVSIIIPLFNRLDLTRACLASLEKTLVGWRYEVILIDDGSTDGTRDFLSALPPRRFRVVLNDAPRGYAANNNAGARLARAPLLCLLNNDTALRPRWLEPMARLAKTLPDVAMVGNVQREPVSGLIDHFGVFFDAEGQAIHAGKDAAVAPAEDYLEWPVVTAACCVIRRRLFLDLGGFDEGFRNGFEDVDFCLRAHTRGYRHFVANRSVIYHHVSASPGRKTHDRDNFRLFCDRWLPRLARDFRGRQVPGNQREEGWRYLRKHRWQPWRYNVWRFARALEQIRSPLPPSRRLDWFPRALFRGQDLRWLRRSQRTPAPAHASVPEDEQPIFLIVGGTVQNPAHSGVATVVRNLAGAFGRVAAPVRLVYWDPATQSLRLLPPDYSVGLDAENLREASPALASSLFDSTAADPEAPLARGPSLHELPGPAAPRGAWVLLPEVPPKNHAAQLAEYVHRHGWRLAVIFHDALATNEPQWFPPDAPNAHAAYLRAISGSDLILPVSEFSAADWQRFVETKSLPQPPVQVCTLAADTCVRVRTTVPPPPREPGEPIRLLCVSAVAPRKNHRTLLAAYDLAVAARPDLNLELCCIGEYRVSSDQTDAVLHDAMRRHPGKVTWYERVDYSTLRKLYEGCAFTVYPSVLEGFGLPILESLWFRRPCVCANIGAMEERARGGGCFATDVRDPQALADAILTLADSSEWLENLACEIDRRHLPSWDEYARMLLQHLRTTGTKLSTEEAQQAANTLDAAS